MPTSPAYVRMSSSPSLSRPAIADRSTSDHSPAAAPVVRSALWAAYGDALGFPAELADAETLQRRLGGELDVVRPWKRRIGGRMGPIVELPAGCTSDDTQLRLAVGRCVRASGRFDVEAFSKIELPVFLSYQLGAGRGTKAAAQALGRRTTRWYANFYDSRGSRYVDGGGNGAAMRVQPHVWAGVDKPPETYLAPVLRDVVCTHGHPRALLGAALHALALGTTLREQEVPRPDRWVGMVSFLECVMSLVARDETLAERWAPRWEAEAKRSLPEAMAETLAELDRQVRLAAAAASTAGSTAPAQLYADLVADLGGLSPKTRGAGTTTAVLALWIAWVHQDDARAGVRLAAGLLGSDTDTIATLTGALLGSVADADPPGPLLDSDLIAAEARRLHALSTGQRVESFPHPDPLVWQAPSSLADVVGLLDGRVAVTGLGPAGEEGAPLPGSGPQAGLWQWLRTDYGQRLLVKRRAELRELAEESRPRRRALSTEGRRDGGEQPSLFDNRAEAHSALPQDPGAGVALLAAHQYDRNLMGRLLEHYASSDSAAAAEFATLLSARLSDRKPDRSGPATPRAGPETP